MSALYAGVVTHQRFAPKRHFLRYRLFQMLFDLDETPSLARRLRLFSHDAFNLVAFHDRDHGDGRAGPLRGWVEDTLARAGLPIDGGRILLLCMPRILGHVFNPLSIYFCHRRDGALAAMLYEVNNTFGERHSYLIPVTDPTAGTIRQSCAKAFHVSPFMDMAMTYHFRLALPAERVAVAIEGRDAAGPVISAAFAGRRSPLTDWHLLKAFLRHPLLAMQVLGAIHWEALKLWRKGVKIRRLPPLPADPVSIGPGRRTA